MTVQQLLAVVAEAGGAEAASGWQDLSDATLTLHVAHSGASLSVSRIQRLRLKPGGDGTELLQAEAERGQAHFIAVADVYAVTVEPTRVSDRKAGFV